MYINKKIKINKDEKKIKGTSVVIIKDEKVIPGIKQKIIVATYAPLLSLNSFAE